MGGDDVYNKLFKPALEQLQQWRKVKKPRPDNFVFRLHYQLTLTMLGVAALMVTSYNFIDRKGCYYFKQVAVEFLAIF